MDTAGAYETGDAASDGALDTPMFDLGGDERRMHVRAYNHWVSLLRGAPFPAIADLDPASIADFGPHSVLLDFQNGIDDPAIAWLGTTLGKECGLEGNVARIAEVPSRSLLSRLTDHYLQIIANRAPIGFEAEFVGSRGHTTLYRGILMPFSSNGEQIDFIYGVINWKEMVDAATQARLAAELDAAVRSAPALTTTADAPVWADRPSAGFGDGVADPESQAADGTLGERLAMARESAAQVRAADTRSRAALYRALARAHDFGLAAASEPESYAGLLTDAVIKEQPRAPLTPVVKLVFGADYDKTRLAEYAAVLAYARRQQVGAGALAPMLESFAGGVKAVVAAERAARRSKPKPDVYAQAAEELRAMPVLAHVQLAAEGEEFVLLVARAGPEGALDVVARVAHRPLVEDAVRRAAA